MLQDKFNIPHYLSNAISQKLIAISVSLLFGFVIFFLTGASKPELHTSNKSTIALLPQYLTFQIFTYVSPLFGLSNTNQEPKSASREDIADIVDDIINKIDGRGTSERKLGFVVGPLVLDYTDDQLRQLIKDAFSVAKEKNIAVGFHIDDSMFWGRRKLLSEDPKNIEWIDWQGTLNTGRQIAWDIKPVKLFPHLCFNSPDVQKELRRVGTEVIGNEIKKGVDELRQLHKEELFAGVIVGWETQLGRDFDSNKTVGFCALANKGFSEKNPPADLDQEREKIVKEFVEFWSKNIADAGIDPQKIFSHISFMAKKTYDENKVNFYPRFHSYTEAANFSPPEVAFGKYHRPGFSTYPAANLFPEIYDELTKNGNPPWASSEGTNIALPYSQGEDSMETYLARMFNHGAVLMNIFGWGIGGESEAAKANPFRIQAEKNDSVSAYRKFLRGEVLKESPLPSAYGLQAKMKKIQERLPQWLKSGGDQSLVEPLLKQIEHYSNEANPFGIEKTADKIFSIINPEEIQLNSVRQAITLISPGISHPKNAAEGLKRFTDSMDILTENGMNLFLYIADWKDLELSPYEFHLQERLINPLTLLLPKYPQVKGVVLVLKMIDTNWKPMPADLETKSFDDPEVLKRFDALIDAIAAEPSSKRITHILLGNEIDGYLGQNPEETEAFDNFYNRALLRIHKKLPQVKVGTIFTAGGVLGNANIANFFNKINRSSDFIDYTYYPVYGLERGSVSPAWQMAQVSDIKNNLTDLAERAGNKPFAFTEIGYSASPLNGSSEEKQADFVQEMFRVLTPYQKKGQIEFLLYNNMYDYAPEVCIAYAKQQGVPSDAICAFMENLGLRSYETGAPRKAWHTFVEGVQSWISDKQNSDTAPLPANTGRLIPPNKGAYIGTWSLDLTSDMRSLSLFQQLTGLQVKIDHLDIFIQRTDGSLQNIDEPLTLTVSGHEVGPSPLALMKVRAEAGIVTALQIHVPDGNVDEAFRNVYQTIPEDTRRHFGLREAIPQERRICLQDILDGKYDDYFFKTARSLKDFGYPVMFEILNEYDLEMYENAFGQDGKTHHWDALNGAGFFKKVRAKVMDFQAKHGRDPAGPAEIGLKGFPVDGEALYTAYGDPKILDGIERVRDTWRHVHDIFDEAGAANVTWYNHAAGTRGAGRVNEQPLKFYWPGENYMDWTGTSSYCRYPYTAEKAQGKLTLEESVMPWYRETAGSEWGRLPLIMHELSQIFPEHPQSPFGGKDNLAQWIEALFSQSLPQSLPRIKAFFLIFNNFGPIATWSKEELLALRKYIGENPYYAATLQFNPDHTPPGKIIDLKVGVIKGGIKLSWTAPGDDENMGTAARYIIKYRTERYSHTGGVEKDFLKEPWRIWSYPDTYEVIGSPQPLPAGTKQEIIILLSSLKKSPNYYFAIQAVDDVPYNSQISSVAEVKL